MIKKLIAIIIVLLVLSGVSGCTSDKIKNEEQASQAVVDVSETIGEVSSTLEDVDKSLSGK